MAYGMRLGRMLAVACLGLGLTACANLNSIHRQGAIKPVDGGAAFVSVDAKQRLLVTTGRAASPGASTSTQLTRVCAEPPPDAFSVLSSSLSGDLGLGVSDEVKAKFAASMAESGSTIDRTQTVNLLRELMFRTCERYLNDGIGPDELAIQAARDQRIMVSIMAIEQLTQAARPGPVILSPPTTAASIGVATEAREEARNAAADAATADAVLKEAQDDYKTANQGTPNCDKRLSDFQDVTKVTPETDKPAWTACKTAKDKVVKLEGAAMEARAKRDSAERMAVASGGTGATTGTLGVQTPIVLQSRAAADLATVSGTVERIVLETFKMDELQMLCLSALRGKAGENETLKATCLEYFQAKAADGVRAMGGLAEVRAYEARLPIIDAQELQIRRHLGADEPSASQKWKALLTKANPFAGWITADADKVRNAATIEAMVAAFRTFAPRDRTSIIGNIPAEDGA